MLKYLIKTIFILIFCFGISACAQPNGASIVLSTETPTSISTPSKIPSPTPVPTATITPYPTLSIQKPYLLIRQSEQAIVEYDSEGLGRKVIELPHDGYIPYYPRLDRLVSPDGKWLAFYIGNVRRGNTQEILPVTLNLLNISSGEVIKIADVVTDGYIEKLGELAEELEVLYPEYYKPTVNQDWVFDSILSAFTWSIHSVSWAPDGHKLAFAAQIDGLSSDVYLFNLDTNTVQQIENTIQNVNRIYWSPDGQYILFENSEPEYGSSLYTVQPSGHAINNPKKLYEVLYGGGWIDIGNWLSPNLLLIADGADVPFTFNLQSLDIRTGQLRSLWADTVDDYAIDPLNKIILLNAGELAEPETFGVYFITYNGQKTKVLEGLYSARLFFRGGEQHRFLMWGFSHTGTNPTLSLTGDIVGFDIHGEPNFIVGKYDYDTISISPDKAWLLRYDENNLYLYDVDDNLTQTFPANGVYSVIWRPDSQAIFFSAGEAVYFLPIPNGMPRLVDECKEEGCLLSNITWLP